MKTKHSILIAIVLIAIIGIIYYILYSFKGPTDVDSNQDITFLRNYQVNEFVPVYMSDEQMASIYFNHLMQKLLYRREEAYQLLDVKFKEKNFPSYEEFDRFLEERTEKITTLTVASSSVKRQGKQKIYYVSDIDDNSYTFFVDAVMMYTVSFEMV